MARDAPFPWVGAVSLAFLPGREALPIFHPRRAAAVSFRVEEEEAATGKNQQRSGAGAIGWRSSYFRESVIIDDSSCPEQKQYRAASLK